MKRTLLFLVALISLGMVSCKKYLDTTPTDFLTESQYYNTAAKVNAALAGVYQPLSNGGMYGAAYWEALTLSTDEAYYAFSSTGVATYNYNYDYTDSNVNNFWTQSYVGIERANILIQNINLAPMDSTSRKNILGQALFLRGYYYFLLVSNFGDVPLKLTPTASVNAVNVPRTPAKAVYAQILQDMTAAEGMVYSATTIGYGGQISKTAVEGILARVCLTMAGSPINDQSKYQDASNWASKVVASGIHSLNPSYQQVFTNLINNQYDIKESMWEIEFRGNGTDATSNLGALGSWDGIAYSAVPTLDFPGYAYAFVRVPGKFCNLFTAGDRRRDWVIAPYTYNTGTVPVSYAYSAAITTVGQPYSGRSEAKFRREYDLTVGKAKNNTPCNFPVLRYADVLLMQAEAENQLNGPDAVAYNAINQIRRRAFGLDPNTPVASISVVNTATFGGGNTGYAYSTTAQADVPLTITGGGGTGAAGMASIASTGKVSGVFITNPGTGYTSVPTITVGLRWAAATNYAVGQQVTNGSNLYTVTTAGTSTATGPTNTSGASVAATTGAVFTYAGAAATVTALIATTNVDLTPGLSQAQFQQAIQDERSRELCYEGLRRADLIRWGIWVQTMNATGADMKANGGGQSYGGFAGSNVSVRNNLFPIPSSEMTSNKAAVQNPGW